MLKTLEGRLALLFAAFTLLVLISAGATYWGLQIQRQDAVVIDLAGRQRMLAQQMARLAYGSGQGQDAANAALQATEQAFDQTMRALLSGGLAPYRPDETVILQPTRNVAILAALNAESRIWLSYSAALDRLQQTPPSDPSFLTTLRSIQEQSTTLAQQADAVVRLYDADSVDRANRLRLIQVGFLAAALSLLVAAGFVIRGSVLRPLSELTAATVRLAENDLNTAVQVHGPQEIEALSRSFDAMRLSLLSSRVELTRLNEQLEERVAQRTRELETLNQVSSEISSRLDIHQVLNSVTDKARSLLGGEIAALCLVDESRQSLDLHAISGPRIAVEGDTALLTGGLAEVVLGSSQALLCGTGACEGECRMLSHAYRMSHLASPLRVGERVIGALCVGSTAEQRFSAEATGTLTKLSNAAATALENARLYAQAERVATLEERRRVAAEMHDGLGQTLSYLGLMTDQVVGFLAEGQDGAALQHLHKTRETIGKATADVRRAIQSLMDDSDSQVDLCARLRSAADQLAAEHHLRLMWQAEAAAEPRCTRETAQQVLNIVSEALNNVAHHARAQNVAVRMGRQDDQYSVTVEDDGQGFDAAQPAPSGHFGLQVMKARAAHIGGQVAVDSEAGGGTRVTLTWPVRAGG